MIILHLYVCVSNVELIRTKMIHEERESGQERQKEQSRKIYEDIEKKKERKKERKSELDFFSIRIRTFKTPPMSKSKFKLC